MWYLALEIRRTMLLRFLRKQSWWGSGSRDSGSSVSSIFEKVIMLGVWLSRFGRRCLFDFGVSNLVGSVFSDSDVVGAASFTCSTLAETLTKLSMVPMSYCCVWEVGADKARKEGASSISEIGPRGL
ncbi:hypothetical protein ACFX1R_047860 [Malus domestica]